MMTISDIIEIIVVCALIFFPLAILARPFRLELLFSG